MQPEATKKARLIRFPEVIERTSKSRAAIYVLMNEGKFPQPVKLGSKSIAFVEAEIDAWIDNLISGRDHSQAA
jgi:prophage regulatory protein